MTTWRDTDLRGICKRPCCKNTKIVCRDCGKRICIHFAKSLTNDYTEGTCGKCVTIPFYARQGRSYQR